MAAKKKRYGPARPGRVPTWVKPPAAARKLAKEALARREELPPSRRGGLSRSAAAEVGITSGVDRAKSIARGDWQPAEDLRDFFSRFRGTHASALAAGKAWGQSKVQQSWDLWGGHPMWLAARQALLAAGSAPGAEPNPSSYWSVGPQEPVDVDVPWADETLGAIRTVGADLELRMLMGARLHWIAGRLAFAPSRPRPRLERVTLAEIRPVEYPGAEEGWYLDTLSGRKVVFEDQVNVGWYRERPYPRNAFTVGEMAALTVELVRAAERVADARENLTPAQRELAVQLVEAAEDLELRLAMMQWHPDSPEEAAAMKRAMLGTLARDDNPRGLTTAGCAVLAAHEYVSPRQRKLTAEEHNIRHISFSLKKGRRWAMDEAAAEMAPLVRRGDVLVPVPDSSGSTKYNRRLARRIAKRTGVPLCDALARKLKVPSSRALRAAGLPPLTVEAHEMLRMAGCPEGRVLLVDNVATTGGTGYAAAAALDVPCALLVWAWHRTHEELAANPSSEGCDPDLTVTGPASARRAMDHPAVVAQHKKTLRKRRKHPVAVLIPCAGVKPYRTSPSHSYTYLPAVEGKKVDVWVVSEPMGVIPYEWSDKFPNESYEFAPRHVKGDVRVQLVDRVRAWLERHGKKYKRVYLALPGHHMGIVCDAANREPKLGGNLIDASISACKEAGWCPATHDQVTTRAYRDYLSAAIR